jgi:plasmid stabilization system protein ParE
MVGCEGRLDPHAELDRLSIFKFIAADNPKAAVSIDVLFSRMASRLAKLPHLGRPGIIAGTGKRSHTRTTVLSMKSKPTGSGFWRSFIPHDDGRRPFPPPDAGCKPACGPCATRYIPPSKSRRSSW